MTCHSQAKPLELPFSNNTLTSDGLAISHGISLWIGTPGQQVSLTPSGLVNNTVVNNLAVCSLPANNSCIALIGGGYDPADSSTYSQASRNDWNGSAEINASFIGSNGLFANDIVEISSQLQFDGFPLLVQQNIHNYGCLGLGPGSTLLQRLLDARAIPSRSFSFFAGVYSRTEFGSLILGGYASRYFKGDLITKNENAVPQCDGKVCDEIVTLEYRDQNKSINLMQAMDHTRLFGIIDPFFPTMIVPDVMVDLFQNSTNGYYNTNATDPTWATGTAPTGNITVSLASGLSTTIPNQAFLYPNAYLNNIGSRVPNGTTYGLLTRYSRFRTIRSLSNRTDIAILGMPYAAYIYLIRDYERGQFSIAEANQDAWVSGDVTTICSTTSMGSGGNSSTGVIVGGVVGGLAGIALFVLLVWLIRRRKRNHVPLKKAEQKEGVQVRKEFGGFEELEIQTPIISRFASPSWDGSVADSQANTALNSHELPAKERRAKELPATELPKELPACATTRERVELAA